MPNTALNLVKPDGSSVQATADASGNLKTAISTAGDTATTGTLSNVASSASNVTLLAANTARRGATVYNDSTAVLYLKLGATASATSYTVQLNANDYFEVPFRYAGIIDGLWASANGFARVTELT